MKMMYVILILTIVILSVGFLLFYNEKSDTTNSISHKSTRLGLYQGSLNPSDNRSIGFEYLNDSGSVVNEASATVIHTWNSGYDYFFNKTSGIQFTNHFQEYWSRNSFCGGYKNSSNDWDYDCTNSFNFNAKLITDNLTYINYTLFKNKSVGSKIVRLEINYHLKLEDDSLSVIVSAENVGNSNINNDIGFAWVVDQIQIRNDTINDKIYINRTAYYLNESLDLTFRNMSFITVNDSGDNITEYPSYYILKDGESFSNNGLKFIRLNWDRNLKYRVEVKDVSGQDNARVILGINGGKLNQGQKKSTTFYWEDPTEIFFEDCSDLSDWDAGGWSVAGGSRCQASNGFDTLDLTSTFSMSGITTANISAEFFSSNLDEADGDHIAINMSNDSGTNWYQVWRYDAVGANDGTTDNRTQILENNVTFTANMLLRLICSSGGGERCTLDSINITDFSTTDTINPDLNITFPQQNNSNFTVNDIEINYTRSDDVALDSCWYSNDTYSVNITLASCANITGVTWSNALHNLTIWVNDTTNNVNQSSISFNITSAADTCDCAGTDNNWEVDMSDNCILSTACDLGNGNLSFINTGNFTCDANLNVSNVENVPGSSIFYVFDECRMEVTRL